MNSFMQNKPNFIKNRTIVSYGILEGYENVPLFLDQKSQTQFPKRQNVHKSCYSNEL